MSAPSASTPPPPIVAREHASATRDVMVGDGVRLSVVDDGPRNARETMLFLHGNPMWSFLWRKLLRAGIEAGHRVVAPDHAGCGRSGKPEDPHYYTLERHIRNLEATVQALDLRLVTLVMHDWGGPIGMGFAARHPDLVRRIVVANTSAFAPKKPRAFTLWHATMGSPLGQWAGVHLNLVAESALRYGVRKPMPREVREAYLWPMRERGARVAAARFVRMVPDGPQHESAVTLRAMEAEYAKLRGKPMLVLWADKDPVMRPGLAERWTRSFPEAEVQHVAPEAGHFWQEDAPEAFLGPLLDFVGNSKA